MSLDRIRYSIASAIIFLKDRLLTGNFGLSCVGPDGTPRFSNDKGHLFTGFFVGEALAGRLCETARTILLRRILAEEQQGLWGYSPPGSNVLPEHEPFVVDSDDTAYVLRTLRRLGVNRPPDALLRFHRPNMDAFTTFNFPGECRLVTEPSAENNLMAHPEVNANVFLALRGTHCERYVNYDIARYLQESDGHWPSFYYPSTLFSTHLFLQLLHGVKGCEALMEKGIKFVEESQNSDGSWGTPGNPYETALALNAMQAGGRRTDVFTRGIGYLLDTMQAEGSWHSDNCIWRFHKDASDVWLAYDVHGAFTSALCLSALIGYVPQ